MRVKDFDYYLPEELIAQDPLEDRSSSKLLVLDRISGERQHRHFGDIIEYMQAGDCLVINDTRVIPARLLGFKEDTGAHVEILLLKRKEADVWECLVRPGKKLRQGARVVFGEGLLKAEIVGMAEEGNRLVRFIYDGIFEEVLDRLGEMPLPPYITHKLQDKNRYQTVYAVHEGSAAAPTAGLHFTKELLDRIEEKGIRIARLTLHVGLGTFRPVKAETVEEHHMHSEYYIIGEDTAGTVNDTLKKGHRVFSVGTTSTRTMESAAVPNPEYKALVEQGATVSLVNGLSMIKKEDGSFVPKYLLKAGSNETSIFIYPGYEWKMVEALITNFHLPQSTLIMLVSAFAGRDHVMRAYEEAVSEGYRFFSFGDAMLLI
ncbi:MAG: tRNA preQ1(34) S-adenosylmethionine ribosyltransferase-isomerase QueA [Eubacteriales bacterium]|nr:tRNA preQ1(34) S-adenosylmethionine ribosyltransferase-isomerase QueA [Eubacteriales bacterium]